MKLSAHTLAVLKNFATINQGIIINPGKQLTTVAKEKYIAGFANIEEEFERKFELWNLPMFLQVLSVLDEPEIEWLEKYALIKSGKIQYKYSYGRNVEPIPPERDKLVNMNFDAIFDLTQDDLKSVMRMANVMSAEQFTLRMDSDTPMVEFIGTEQSEGNTLQLDVDAEVTKPVSMSIKRDHMNIMIMDYTVKVSEGATQFINDDCGLMYLIAPYAGA